MSDSEMNIQAQAESASPPSGKAKRGPRRRMARQTDVRDEPVREEAREASPGVPEKRLKRQRHRHEDRLALPKSMIPPGISYEWKRKSVHGRSDPDHMNELLENHWRPVPQERHPNYRVERDGLILMERPEYLTEEAIEEDRQLAYENIERAKHAVGDTPVNTMTRNHQSVRNITKVNSSHDIAIRGDD